MIESIYWTLLFLCPSLILQTDPVSEPSSPAVLTRVPLRIDLALHAVPGLTLVADFMFLEFKFSKNEARYGATFVVAMASVWYACWVEYCAIFNGICERSLHQVCALQSLTVFSAFLSSLSFPYGESLGDSRWDLCRCCHSRIDIFLDHKWPAPETIVDGNYSYNRTL